MFSGYSIIKVFKNVKFEIKVYLERKNFCFGFNIFKYFNDVIIIKYISILIIFLKLLRCEYFYIVVMFMLL